MKLFRLLTLIALVCGLSVSALGNTFHVKVLDPNSFPTVDLDGSNPSFDVSFFACDQENGGPNNACFSGHNDTDMTFDTLSLTFDSPFLAGVGADCVTNVTLSDFNNSSCPAVVPGSGEITLDFSGTPGITPNQTFIIVESNDGCTDPNAGPCITPDELGNVVLTATVATPEPNSFLLLGSGMMLAGAVVFGRRLLPGA
jgi:hypothetical protein